MKIENNNVIMTNEEYTALISEFNALQHKYNDICDKYRLCKDANETIKQNVIIKIKEENKKTVKEFAEKLKSKFPIFDDKITFVMPEKLHKAIDELAKEYGVGVKI